MNFIKFFELGKFSLGDLLDTLGLVLSRPWKLAEAVYNGGNSVQNALVYYFVLFSVSLMAFLPFGLNDEFRNFAQHFTVTAFLILAVTSVTLFCGLRLAGVDLPFHKALSLKAFIAGAYVLVINALVAMALGIISIFMPEEVPTFSAFAMGCLPVLDFGSGTPRFTVSQPTLSIYLCLTLLSFLLNLFLYIGIFVGLAPFRKRSRWAYIVIVTMIYLLDYTISAAYAGRNLNVSSEYCSSARAAEGIAD